MTIPGRLKKREKKEIGENWKKEVLTNATFLSRT
jgi:hypothetical protein